MGIDDYSTSGASVSTVTFACLGIANQRSGTPSYLSSCLSSLSIGILVVFECFFIEQPPVLPTVLCRQSSFAALSTTRSYPDRKRDLAARSLVRAHFVPVLTINQVLHEERAVTSETEHK
jgi:hypothetical protein